jgi:peptidoglycan/xylan/chitin deacetylase (PgdA/CDA1 family)
MFFRETSGRGAAWTLALVLGAALLAAQPGCGRIQGKLERLAAAARGEEPAAAPEPEPLSEEEQRLNAMLENPDLFTAPEDAPEPPKEEPFELNKSSVVSILGYHDFREKGVEAMVIHPDKFREQMAFIKESGIPVVPLDEVLEWKRGVHNIPEECFVITIDDGWAGVYEHAFPILKEFGFPFTIYLYKNYVNTGGRSMTWDQIREMMESGLCTVGSHSVSHASMTSKRGRSDEAYQEWLVQELAESKEFLESNLGVEVNSFAYPYGNYNTHIRDLGHELGYETLVTVNGSKVRWDTTNGDLGRFIIHGNNDSVFQLATTFRGRSVTETPTLATDAKAEDGKPLVALSPEPGSVVNDRTPLLRADLSSLGPVKADSIRMQISGLGTVRHQFDPETGMLVYQVPFRLRRERCDITLTFNREGEAKADTVLWSFRINLAASYLPAGAAPAADMVDAVEPTESQ